MSQDTEDLAARLTALEATGDKKRAAARPSPLMAILGVAGIVAVGDMEKVKLLDMSIDIGIWPIQRVDFFRCGRRSAPNTCPPGCGRDTTVVVEMHHPQCSVANRLSCA